MVMKMRWQAEKNIEYVHIYICKVYVYVYSIIFSASHLIRIFWPILEKPMRERI